IDEFAEYGYDKASINRIVEQSNIAKGSFYQYFKNKRDLYKHLFTRFGEEKLQSMSPVLANPNALDFFTLITELYRSGLAFAKANPKAARIGNRLFQNRDHPVHQELIEESEAAGVAFFKPLIERAIAAGELRPDINVTFAVHIITTLNLSIFEYYFDVVRRTPFDMTDLQDDAMDTINLFIDFLKNGLGKPEKG
ncbi:MAG: TetR/AcrR family transcriptional regulator, partial [Saprospiraceae bacterium]